MFDDARDHRQGALVAAPDVPELGAIVQIEGGDRARRLGRLHAFGNELASGFRQRRENSAAVKPADSRSEDGLPIEVAGLKHRPRLVRTIVENHGSAHAEAAIAVNGRHVGAVHAIVLEMFVERPHAHGAYALGYQVTNGIVDHRGCYARLQAKAVCQVCGAVEFTTTNMNLAFGGLAKRNDSRIEPVDKGTQG